MEGIHMDAPWFKQRDQKLLIIENVTLNKRTNCRELRKAPVKLKKTQCKTVSLRDLVYQDGPGSLEAPSVPGRASGGGARHSITTLSLLINKEIKDILIKDIFPCLSNACAAAVRIIFNC